MVQVRRYLQPNLQSQDKRRKPPAQRGRTPGFFLLEDSVRVEFETIHSDLHFRSDGAVFGPKPHHKNQPDYKNGAEDRHYVLREPNNRVIQDFYAGPRGIRGPYLSRLPKIPFCTPNY